MKRAFPFLLLLTVLAGVTGKLLAGMGFIGRTSIWVAYREYRFLRIWWQAGAAVLAVWLVLFAIHTALRNRLSRKGARITHIAGLLLAIAGTYFTFREFQSYSYQSVFFNKKLDLAQYAVGSRFQLGCYLFWVGWMLIALFLLSSPKRRTSERAVTRG